MSTSGGDFFAYPSGTSGGRRATAGGASEDFLAALTDADWVLLQRHADIRRYAAGDLVIREGATDRELYIVVEGTLHAEASAGRGGRRVRLGSFEAGSVLGELSFLTGTPRTADVVAATPVELLRLRADRFEALAAQDPALGMTFMHDLARILALRLLAVRTVEGGA